MTIMKLVSGRKTLAWLLDGLALTPVFLLVMLAIINFDYINEMFVREEPMVVGLPCGWLVFPIIPATIFFARLSLWVAEQSRSLLLQITVILFALALLFIGVVIVLLFPSALQIVRNAALQSIIGMIPG